MQSLRKLEANLRKAEADYSCNPDQVDSIVWLARRLGYLDRYQEAMGRAEDLELANRDLSAALTATEESLLQATQELEQLKVMFDEMSALKTQVQQRNLDLAARLATAQIARLEAERSLLEATIEWRAMNARNNAPSGTPTELQATGVR